MSIHNRSGERLEQLLGVYRTDPDVDMDKCAADEIERLREELLAALKNEAHYAKRIEEVESVLSKSIMHQKELDRQHHITTEQIRAAWVECHAQPDGISLLTRRSLRELGIVRCEGPMGRETGETNTTCPDCGGEGWVIGGEDEYSQ